MKKIAQKIKHLLYKYSFEIIAVTLSILMGVLLSNIVKAQPCVVLNPPSSQRISLVNIPAVPGYSKHVNIYVECDSILSQAHPNINSYIRDTLFKAVAEIYLRDSIIIEVSEVSWWSTTDPEYGMTSSSSYLYSFASRMFADPPRADLFLLLSASPFNLGGVAYVGVLGSSPEYRVSFCNIYTNPGASSTAYNWNTEVIAHELGHNLGSQHTQWCGWQGGPIDTCWTPEGGCYTGPHIPIATGTIMSYCHLNGSIDFTKGFGLQPKNIIRDNIETAYQSGKLLSPDGACTVPAVILNQVTNNTAQLSWADVNTRYRYRYRKTGTPWPTEIKTDNTVVNLTGLQPISDYQFQLRIKCGNSVTKYSQTFLFKTQ